MRYEFCGGAFFHSEGFGGDEGVECAVETDR